MILFFVDLLIRKKARSCPMGGTFRFDKKRQKSVKVCNEVMAFISP